MVCLVIHTFTVLCHACVLDCVTEWKKLAAEVGWRGPGLMNTQLNVAAAQSAATRSSSKTGRNLRDGLEGTT